MFVLPLDSGDELEARARAVTMALELQGELARRELMSANVRFVIALQIGSLVTARGDAGLKIVGGELLALNTWPMQSASNAVTVSAEMKRDLESRFLLEPLDEAQTAWRVVGSRT
jgi:hypothetical protein